MNRFNWRSSWVGLLVFVVLGLGTMGIVRRPRPDEAARRQGQIRAQAPLDALTVAAAALGCDNPQDVGKDVRPPRIAPGSGSILEARAAIDAAAAVLEPGLTTLAQQETFTLGARAYLAALTHESVPALQRKQGAARLLGKVLDGRATWVRRTLEAEWERLSLADPRWSSTLAHGAVAAAGRGSAAALVRDTQRLDLWLRLAARAARAVEGPLPSSVILQAESIERAADSDQRKRPEWAQIFQRR